MQQADIRIDGIYDWDWRYRIGFDKHLSSKVMSACARLPTEQRLMLEATHAWATSFVSLDALLDALATGTVDAQTIHAIDPETVLHVPEELSSWLQNKVALCSERLGRNDCAALKKLIQTAGDLPYLSKHLELFSLLFGKEFDVLLEASKNNSIHAKPPANPISKKEIVSITENFRAYLSRQPRAARWMRHYDFPSFSTTFLNDNGWYGEYWPVDLAPDAVDDRLIVYTGEQNRDRNVLLSTLTHEVFPGHGLFYKLVKEKRASFIDHGATCLIEGWATWCDWHTIENAYAEHSRSMRIEGLKYVHCTSPREIIVAADRLAHMGQLETRREQRMTTIFQYPGLSLSYALGALWFERHLDPDQPAAIFDHLTRKPWGDFFSSWSDPDASLSIASDYLSRG